MHKHRPRNLTGPLRGTPAWWRGLDPQPEAAAWDDSSEYPRKGTDKDCQDSSIRMDLVARVRKEIAAGTYDTPERWEAALDRLFDRLAEE